MRDRLIIDVAFLPAEGEESAGYLATCDEIGLVVEADDLDALVARVRAVLPDLLRETSRQRGSRTDPVLGGKTSPTFELRHVLIDGDGLLQGTA